MEKKIQKQTWNQLLFNISKFAPCYEKNFQMCLLQEVIITEMGFAKDEYIQLQDECP